MIAASRVSRKTTKKTGTEKTSTAIALRVADAQAQAQGLMEGEEREGRGDEGRVLDLFEAGRRWWEAVGYEWGI